MFHSLYITLAACAPFLRILILMTTVRRNLANVFTEKVHFPFVICRLRSDPLRRCACSTDCALSLDSFPSSDICRDWPCTVGGNIKTSKYSLCVCDSLGKRMLPFIPTNTTSDSFRSRNVLARDSYHLTLFLKCDPRKPLEVSNACNFVTLLNITILRKKLWHRKIMISNNQSFIEVLIIQPKCPSVLLIIQEK